MQNRAGFRVASLKAADLDLHCYQNNIYPGSAGQGLTIPSLNYILNDMFLEAHISHWMLREILEPALDKMVLSHRNVNTCTIDEHR